MMKLVLLRHGQSIWNKENRFTGWTDVPLTDKGIREALAAGRDLKREKFVFDVVFTSVLKRAIKTLWLVLEEMDLMWIRVHRSWRLNERHYGALQGLNKAETVSKHGMEQVQKWRRSYNIRPPSLTVEDDRYPGKDEKYAELLPEEIPLTESLEDTIKRFLPFWKSTIAPEVKQGRSVLICAHGNSLRALVKHLDRISNDQIVGFNIPTGIPLVYELNDDLTPISHYYIGDPDLVRKATQAVADQLRKDH